MQKKKKSWLDIQIILASLAVTLTVGLWNVFAMANRQVASAAGNPPVNPPPADPTNTSLYHPSPTAARAAATDPNAPLSLPVVHILMGGSLPVVRVAQTAPTAGSSEGGSVSRSTGGGSGGGTTNPPPPPTTTGSSKP
jgi:hypothetical protein